jgi:hypothetical protein
VPKLLINRKHKSCNRHGRLLRRIFESKRGEITRGWRRLHNEELHNFYSLPNISRMIKSKRMRWAGNIICTG